VLPVLSPANAIVLPHIISADAAANAFLATVFFINISFLFLTAGAAAGAAIKVSSTTLRMAMSFITVVPILCVYPSLHKIHIICPCIPLIYSCKHNNACQNRLCKWNNKLEVNFTNPAPSISADSISSPGIDSI